MLQKRRQMRDDLAADAGMTMSEIGDLGRNDRPHLARIQQRTNATGMAENDRAGKSALCRPVDNCVRKRADTGVDAIGPYAARNDAVQYLRCPINPRIGGIREATCFAFADTRDGLPVQPVIKKNGHVVFQIRFGFDAAIGKCVSPI